MASTPTPVRYDLHILAIDTTALQSNTVLEFHLRAKTQDDRAVVAAAVDFGATEGHVHPPNTTVDSDGYVSVIWTIPPGPLVANLYGCARPPGQSCSTGPLFKWNQ